MSDRRTSRRLIGAGLIGGLATSCGIALTATSGWLIVQASTMPPILTLLAAIVAVRAFGIGRPVLRYAERMLAHDAAFTRLVERRTMVYTRLVPLTPARLGAGSRSDVLTAVVRDLDDQVYAAVRVLVPLVGFAVAAVVATLGCAVVSPGGAAVCAALVAAHSAGLALTYRGERRTQDAGLAARADAARIAALVTSNATHVQAVHGGPDAMRRLDDAHARVALVSRRTGGTRAASLAWQHVATAAATVTMAVIVSPEVGGRLSSPVAALLLLIPVALGDAAAGLPDIATAAARAVGAGHRLAALLDQEPAVREVPVEQWFGPDPNDDPERQAGSRADPVRDVERTAPPRLEMSDVTARWTIGDPVIGPLDIDLAPGSRVAVVGPNGSGKSTILAVLARTLDPDGGRYRVDGREMADWPVDEIRGRIAIVDDEPHVFDSTVRENLRLARPAATDTDLVAALDQAGLIGWFAALPAGLDTRIGSSARGLSGGERARLAIARALVSARPVILLDEPVAHLDHATAQRVLADLAEHWRGHSVVMVSHRPEGLERFDTVLDTTPPQAR